MIDVEKIGERGNNYEDFMKDLLKKDGEKDDCRFASKFVWTETTSSRWCIFLLVFDYEYKFAPQGAEAQVDKNNSIKK